jgi:alpha/beta superfamily hydrolase
MNAQTERLSVAGPAGPLECAIDRPAGTPVGTALICHPHPLHGGTMDNKVVQTLARAFVALGHTAVRFNFRGTGASGGTWDAGRGEVDDVIAVAQALRDPARPLVLGGFSFGAAMAAHAAAALQPRRLVLVGPAVLNFAPPPVSQDSLVIHGEADEVVPLAAVLDWARPQVLPVVVVPGVGHFFHGQLGLLKQLILGAWHQP